MYTVMITESSDVIILMFVTYCSVMPVYFFRVKLCSIYCFMTLYCFKSVTILSRRVYRDTYYMTWSRSWPVRAENTGWLGKYRIWLPPETLVIYIFRSFCSRKSRTAFLAGSLSLYSLYLIMIFPSGTFSSIFLKIVSTSNSLVMSSLNVSSFDSSSAA